MAHRMCLAVPQLRPVRAASKNRNVIKTVVHKHMTCKDEVHLIKCKIAFCKCR